MSSILASSVLKSNENDSTSALLLLNFLSRDGTPSLHLPRLHFKVTFFATLTLDPLLYNLHHAGGKKTKPKHENSQVKGNAAKKENFK